jgi:hypothetical protein
MNREALLAEILRRRKLGIALVLTGLSFIFLFAGGLLLSAKLNGPSPSCRTSPLIDGKSQVEMLTCMAQSARTQEKGLLLVPVAIGGGALVTAGAVVLLYPATLRVPQRARDATWETFSPRAELDLGPALLR